MSSCTYIDGIASSQAIDTAGEIVDLAGLDCSSLVGGAYNWEHKSDLPAQTVGKILEYKKIFSDADCENDRHKYYWAKIQIPFLYVMGRLFDDKKESSKEVAALFLDDAQHPDEPKMVGFSIEGAKISKEGAVITRSIARKVTVTGASANKTCVAEMVPAENNKKDDIDSIFKKESGVEIFNLNSPYIEVLRKKEEMKKDVGTGGGAFIGSQLSASEKLSKSGWTQGSVGNSGAALNFTHPEHGMVSVHKNPEGTFDVRHNGASAGMKGVKGSGFATPQLAGKHAGNYMSAVSRGTTAGHKMQNRPSPQMLGKAMEAGSGMAAPSQLVQGAALSSEQISKPGKKKSKWLERAEQEYSSWKKREQFEQFMAKKMPHLSKGEISAIGKVMALHKSMAMEKALSRINAAYEEDNHMGSSIKKSDKK